MSSLNVKDIGAQATQLQNTASNPMHNVWVGASAGTGKTKVLTDRVLRLLLPQEGEAEGANPENILCITFTKAGASEMIARVMGVLSNWAVCRESKLDETLENLLGQAPTINQRRVARQLFATVIDLPNGLNITTIHAFCQSLLGRFTLEANLPANFSVMDDAQSRQLISHSKNTLLKDFLNGDLSANLSDALSIIAVHKNANQLDSLIQSIVSDRQKILKFVRDHGDVENAIASIYQLLNISPSDTEEDVFNYFFDGDNFPREKIVQLAKAFEHGAKKNQTSALNLYDFCSASMDERRSNIQAYISEFLKKDGEPKADSTISKNAQKYDVQAFDIFVEERDRMVRYADQLKNIKTARSTACLIRVAVEILSRYESAKINSRVLDYDDLISKTHELLVSEMNQWVLYKIDNRIDNILVDEAQDTSPEQWSIILALVEEFYSGYTGHEEREINRTLFVVGDIKQSIFSFQGANPDKFSDVKKHIETMVEQSGKSWANIPMNTSFRSTQAVLSLVDKIFEVPYMYNTLTMGGEEYRNHLAFRQGQSGRIDLWPIYKAPKQDDRAPWKLPTEIVPSYNAQSALAEKIATQIQTWIENGEILKSTGRAITPGDIMILMRSRNALVDHLIRALKSKNIPVSGADRLKIGTHIAVMDVLAVIDFACMPEDDLALACILKSPLVGMGDAQIEDIAYGRKGALWGAFKKSEYKDTIAWLSNLVQTIPSQNAFGAISAILTLQTPVDGMNGWNAMMARLGEDCFDPLDELLSLAQCFDHKNAGASVSQFVRDMRANNSEIKRELDDADGLVRIMTVHASKGLQSPIVFLPDTTSLPRSIGTSDDGFLWDEDTNTPLWFLNSDEQNQTVKSLKEQKDEAAYQEYNRLLYVALTRAEDRLIVCGTLNKRQSALNDKSWYASVHSAMNDIGVSHDWDAGDIYITQSDMRDCLIYETANDTQKQVEENEKQEFIPQKIPAWVTEMITMDHYPPRVLSPSKMDEEDMVAVRSPLSQIDDSYRFQRGNLTHGLLQYLPDVDVDARAEKGTDFLNKQASDLNADIQSSILNEVIAILNHPEFSEFFGEGSMAEVPVTGVVDNSTGRPDIISGQIDRLLVQDNEVWIVDFKSNRPPPRDIDKVPNVYKKQLKAYKTLIQDIYPNHKIKCALLWTDGPFMSVFDNL